MHYTKLLRLIYSIRPFSYGHLKGIQPGLNSPHSTQFLFTSGCNNPQINKEQFSDQLQQFNHSHEKSHYNKHMEGEQGHVTNITRPRTYTHSNNVHPITYLPPKTKA